MQNAAADCTVQQLRAAVVCICLHDQIQQSHCGFNPAAKTFPSGPKRVQKVQSESPSKTFESSSSKRKESLVHWEILWFLKNRKLYSSFLSQFQSLYFGEQSPLGAMPVALDRAARQQKRSLYSSSILASLSRGAKMTIDRPSCW